MVVNLTNRYQAIETFGLTPLEAMSCGLPVIVPTVGGVTEIVDDSQNGFFIDVQDLSRIESCIVKMLSDKKMYESLSKHALLASRKYDMKHMVEELCICINPH